MGTQGNGSRVSAIRGDEAARGWPQRAFAKLSSFLGLVMVVAALWSSAVRAQTSNYVYDADGRVVAVTQNNGTTAQYTYDALGHLAQTTSVASGQLAIFVFIPTHGEAGTQVTIEGQGFSSSPASDSVAFNDTPATVISASATQIVTMVPAGATTGPISVSTGGNTAVSAMPFVVDDTGLPPSITQVSPTAVAVGSTVTITGTNLAPVSGETAVKLGATGVVLSSASNTQLQFVVPATATGGYLTVITPYGQATSAVPIAVLPANVSLGNVVSSGNATVNGSGVNLAIGAGGQVGVVMFNGVSGNWLSLQLSGITTTASSIGYAVYGPGNTIVSQGSVSSTSPSIHLPQLIASGNYYATFQPSNAGAQLTVAVVTDAVLNGPLNMKGAAPWQSERVLFAATTNQNLELTLNGISDVGGSNNEFVVYVYTASGTEVSALTCYVSNPGSSCQIHLWNMAAGTYTVTVVPNNGGTVGFNMLLTPDVAMPAITIGNPAALSFAAGQVQRFTFNATAGQTVALNVTGTTTPTAANTGITFMVFRPDSGVITSSSTPYTSFDTYNTSTVNLSNLPVSGTYTIIAAPDYGLAAAGQLNVVPGATGNLTTNGSSASYGDNVAGQNVYISFTATQGENLELTLNHLALTGGGNSATVYVYNSAGAQVSSFNCYTSNPGGSCHGHLWDMVAGNYSLAVTPPTGNSITFNAVLEDDLVGSAITVNGSASLSLAAGQVERFTFNAVAGQTLAINMSGMVTTPSGQGVTVSVYRPDVGTITNGTSAYASFDTANSPTLNLPSLPAAGTYTVIVSPDYGLAASGQVNVLGGIGGTLASGGVAQTEAATVSMQNVYMTFAANQGDNLELTLNNVSFSSSNYVNAQVTTSTGQYVANVTCSSNMAVPSCTLHLWNLAAGNYSVTVTPTYSGTYSFNAALQPDVNGPSLQTNTPVNVNLAAGQVERVSFNATQGQTVSLQLSNISVAPTGNGVGITFLIYSPNVGLISTSTGSYTHVDTTGSYTFNLPNLPLTGTYTVIVAPDDGVAATAQLNLVSGVTGSVPVNGTQQSYASTTSGQNVYLSFTVQQGANLELTLNNLTANGGGSQGANVTVLNAAGTQIGSFTDYSSYPSGSETMHLWDLPAGPYSVVVSPTSSANGGTMNFNVMLQPDVVEPTISAGVPTEFSIGAGQVQRYTFNANAGDTVTLQFSQVVITPSGTDIWLPVSVYRPDVGVITSSTSTYSSNNVANGSLTITMSNLPVSGSYTVVVGADYGLPATGEMYLTDTSGGGPVYSTPTLQTNGTPVSETGSGAGQSVTMTFNVTSAQNVEVTLNNINVPGATANGLRVDVYSPSGADLYGFYCYASNPGASCNHGYYVAAAGTYTIVVSTPYGGTLNFSAQVQPWITGTALAANTPTAVNLAAGQVEQLTFSANAGDNVALTLANAATTPGGQSVYMYVARPDQGPSLPSYTSTYTSSSTTLNLTNLPVSGTYSVIVYTAYGEAGSATLTLVPDSPISLIENGSAQSVSTSDAGENVYGTFTANQGDNLELTLANIATANGSAYTADVYVYGPNGNEITYAYCNSNYPGNDCRLSLWNLAAGTYSVTITPSSNLTMSFNMLLLSDITGPNLTLSTPTTINLGLGQVQRVTFNGTQGATYALNLSGASTTPGGQYVYVTVYRPDAGTLTGGNYYTYTSTTGGTTINLPNLPVSGTYSMEVYTNYGEPGQVTLNLLPGVTGQIATNATPQTFSTSVAGQDAYLSFNGNAGDNLELTFTGITGSFNANVYNQNGTQLGNSIYCYASNSGSSCTDSLWNLPAGAYSVVITGGPATFSAQLNSDVTGTTLTANTPATINLAAGEVERLTFNGVQGSPATISLVGVGTTPANQYVYACIYGPGAGVPIATNYCGGSYANYYAMLNTASNQALNITSLPATGTYTVVVGQYNYGLPSSVQVLLTNGVTEALAPDGAVNTFAATTWDQNYYASFTANPGDNLELAFSNIAVPGNSFTGGLNITVYDQTGKTIISYDECGDSGSCIFPLLNLAGGTYQVVVNPAWNGTMSFNVQLTHDVIEPALVPNTTLAVTLPQGTVQRYSFSGSVGQSVSLNIASLATTPSNNDLYMYVLRPDGGPLAVTNSGAPTNYYAEYETTGGTLTLPYLPVAGNYTVVLESGNGVPATAQFTYSTGAPVTLVSGGATQSFALSSTQNASLSFSANTGDNLELSLNNIIATGGNNGALAVTVYDPNGNTVTNFNCYAGNPGSSCNQSLWNLVAGTYTAAIAATGNGTVQFDTELQPDVVAGTLTANTPVQIGPNAAPSPTERFTFAANAGANVTLQLSGVNTTPTGQPMTVSVYRPDVGTITTADAYQQLSTSSTNTLQLTNLPVSGTYTVIVGTGGAVGSAAQLTLTTQ